MKRLSFIFLAVILISGCALISKYPSEPNPEATATEAEKAYAKNRNALREVNNAGVQLIDWYITLQPIDWVINTPGYIRTLYNKCQPININTEDGSSATEKTEE